MSLEAFRAALKSELADELGFPVGDGPLEEGVSERADIASVTIVRWRERQPNVHQRIIEALVQVRLQYVVDREGSSDPGPLEQKAEALVTGLKDRQAAQFGVDFFRVTGVDLEHELYGFTAYIEAWQDNPFTT